MFNLDQYEYFEDINFGLTKYMPEGKKILDVGCGNGLLGSLYKKNNNEYWGIELSKDIETTASKRLDRFFLADITDFSRISRFLRQNKFDIIIFADSLEHFYDPVAVVRFYKNFLKKDGLIYISVPNISVWYARIQILLGKFTYMPCGTFDKTHIRFFTKSNLLQLLKYTGLKLMKLDITPGISRFFQLYIRDWFKKKKGQGFDRRGIIDNPIFKFYAKYIYPVEYYFCKTIPTLFAFQFIAIAKKDKLI